VGSDRCGAALLAAGATQLRRLPAPLPPKGIVGSLGAHWLPAVHQVLCRTEWRYIHIDICCSRLAECCARHRRVAGLIFGGDQMSDWTVMAVAGIPSITHNGAYDRIAAVKAWSVRCRGGRLLFSIGKFTKGKPKYVLMVDGIEVEFPSAERDQTAFPEYDLHGRVERLIFTVAAQSAPVHEFVARTVKPN